MSYTQKSKDHWFQIMGEGLSYLFGTATESDLNTICSGVSILAKSQEEIAHVVDENISVMNITRVEILENRQVLNKIIDSPGKFRCQNRQYYTSMR